MTEPTRSDIIRAAPSGSSRRAGWSINRTVPTPVVDTAGVTTIAVHPGWNLITNPFITPIPWSEIQGLNGPIAIEPIQGFDEFFAVSASMEPYVGYYFFNKDNRATLKIPYPGFVRFSKPAAPDSGSWWAGLALRSGRGVDGGTVSGFIRMLRWLSTITTFTSPGG